MEDAVHHSGHVERLRDIVFQELKSRISEQMLDIRPVPSDEVVNR